MKLRTSLILFLVLLCSITIMGITVVGKIKPVQTETISLNTPEVLVTRVIDGDTIEIEGGQKVRLIGIDTPETVDTRESVQCFGKEASEKTKSLLEGKRVKLEKDVSETDRYGRLLRYIYLENDLINISLVAQGYAKSSTYPPDIKYQEEIKQAESQARESKLGLWSPACSSPQNGL